MTDPSLISVPVFGESDPDDRGYYGHFGGRYVPETLVSPLEDLELAYREARSEQDFVREVQRLLIDYVGRPTPMAAAERLSNSIGGALIILKREDLALSLIHI